MKKIFLCLIVLMALVACNNKSENQNVEGNEAQPETEAAAAIEESQDGWMKQTTLMANKPMVVDFYATWCPPCKELAPVLDQLEKKYEGKVIFQRIDVDQSPELAQEFHIDAIPMLMFITPSGEYKAIVGNQDAPVIDAQIVELLNYSAK